MIKIYVNGSEYCEIGADIYENNGVCDFESLLKEEADTDPERIQKMEPDAEGNERYALDKDSADWYKEQVERVEEIERLEAEIPDVRALDKYHADVEGRWMYENDIAEGIKAQLELARYYAEYYGKKN